MKPILKWQYEQLIKELILLQDHQTDETCPCESDGEMCVRKHLLSIEAYAQETIPIEESPEYKELLNTLANEAKEYREQEERSLCGEDVCVELAEWTREWRKQFEAYSLACESREGPGYDAGEDQDETETEGNAR